MKLTRSRPPVTLDVALAVVLSAIDSDEIDGEMASTLQAALFARSGRAMGRLFAASIAWHAGDRTAAAKILARQS